MGRGYGQLKVRLGGKDVTGGGYAFGSIRQGAFDDLGFIGGVATFGDPRTYGIALEYEFL